MLLLAFSLGVTLGFAGTQILGKRGKGQGNLRLISFPSLNPTSQPDPAMLGMPTLGSLRQGDSLNYRMKISQEQDSTLGSLLAV